MAQYNIFGEIEQDTRPQPEVIEELPDTPAPRPQKKRNKDFQIGVCRDCGQLLLDDPENDRIKHDDQLCEACDSRLSAIYDKYKNLALIKALRAHKYYLR